MFDFKYEISIAGDVMTFTQHMEDYCGRQCTKSIDTEGKTGRALYNHIKKHCGAVFASEARLQGYCPH